MLLAAAVAQTVPWWGTGLFGLLGGVIAAGLGQWFNVSNSKKQAGAERLAAEQALRRETLIAFMTAAHEAGAAGKGADSTGKLFALQSSFIRLQFAQIPKEVEEKALTYLGAITARATNPPSP